jgi:hypothetical protein
MPGHPKTAALEARQAGYFATGRGAEPTSLAV